MMTLLLLLLLVMMMMMMMMMIRPLSRLADKFKAGLAQIAA